MSICTLPFELLEGKICKYLTAKDVFNLGHGNREIHRRFQPLWVLSRNFQLGINQIWPDLFLAVPDGMEEESAIKYLQMINWEFERAVLEYQPRVLLSHLPKSRIVDIKIKDSFEPYLAAISNLHRPVYLMLHDLSLQGYLDSLLANTNKLEKLKLIECECSNIGTILANRLQFTHITSLWLINLDLTSSDVSLIAKGIKNLVKLKMNFNKIMDDGAVAIASAIIESKLEVLELMENQIGRLGFEALINSLPKTKLTELAMLGNEYNADDIQLVFQMLPNCKLNRWSEDRSITIATQKKLIDNLASSQLTYLDLNITPIMIPSLLEASANSKLTAICFRSNDGDSLCSKIAENIHNLYFTEIIFLSYTHMTAKSVGMLFQALQKNSSLTTIILPGKIGNTGVKEISRYFGDTAISSLSIIDGTLDDDSFPYFFHIISTGKLKYLQVSDNKFSEVCIAKFRIASIEFNFHLVL